MELRPDEREGENEEKKKEKAHRGRPPFLSLPLDSTTGKEGTENGNEEGKG